MHCKGECNFGQHEIAFRYDEALVTCDNHSIYKTGAKEIAAKHGKSLTFMAKYDEREGNSCHIHLSFRSTAGEAVLTGDLEHGFSEVMERFIAGQLTCLPDMVDHYTNAARVELDAYDAAVTDWERVRGFERL